MARSDLLDRVHRIEEGGDWRTIRAEIQEEASASDISVGERVGLINAQSALFDAVERKWTDTEDRLREFRNFRSADYRLLLLKEAVSRGAVSMDHLLGITDREIADGRLPPDDRLRFLAQNKSTDLSGTAEILAILGMQPPQKPSFMGRVFGKRSGQPLR